MHSEPTFFCANWFQTHCKHRKIWSIFFWKHILKGLLKASLSGLKPERPLKGPWKTPFQMSERPPFRRPFSHPFRKNSKKPPFSGFCPSEQPTHWGKPTVWPKSFCPRSFPIKVVHFFHQVRELFFRPQKNLKDPPLSDTLLSVTPHNAIQSIIQFCMVTFRVADDKRHDSLLPVF